MKPAAVCNILLIATGLWLNLAVATPVMPLERQLLPVQREAIVHAFMPKDLRPRMSLTCLECIAALGTLGFWMDDGATQEDVENFAINECITLNLYPEDVCFSMVKLAGPEVLYVFNNSHYSHDTMCGWIFDLDCVHTELDPWSVDIPDGKPEPNHPEPEQPTPSVMKILHLTDLHVDLLYDEGSDPFCDHPNCCRNAFGLPEPGEPGAGHWGTLAECDIPLHTLEDLLAQAAELTTPDLVYITGDLPPHDVWAQNHATNMIAIEVTMELVREYFPDVPVLNALGNHASAPVNSFVVPAAYGDGWSMSWLYDGVADLWAEWLPESASRDLRRGGFYQYSPVPGLRVISLNMNFCNTLNWWLLISNEDPVQELKWFVDALSQAEAAGEAVHVIGHIPSGKGSCDHTWSHVFNQIVYRYESTIRGIFFGHTHDDSWELYYDMDTYSRPVAVAFISPAGTTGNSHHPSFKVFEVDGGHDDATWVVLDATTYCMNLTEANMEGGSPVYTARYSTQDSYGVTSMTPTSMHELVLGMVIDETLYEDYVWNVNNDIAELDANSTCDASCLKKELCHLVVSDSSDKTACYKLRDYIDSVNITTDDEFFLDSLSFYL